MTPEAKNKADMNGLANTVLIVEEESMSLNFRIFLGLSNKREKADGSKRSPFSPPPALSRKDGPRPKQGAGEK